jgi:hypothetical protein
MPHGIKQEDLKHEQHPTEEVGIQTTVRVYLFHENSAEQTA